MSEEAKADAALQRGEVLDVEGRPGWKVFQCPHCECQVQTDSVACGIFRHGAIPGRGSKLTALPPHAPQEVCEQFMAQPGAVGCGKPMQIVGTTVKKCEYI